MASDNAVVNAIMPSLNNLLSIRGQLAYIARLYRITRTYNSDGITYTETSAEILPIPNIQERKKDVNVSREGELRRGEIEVKAVSKASYATANLLETISNPATNVIYLYKYQDEYYTIMQLRERLLTWEMELEKWNG